MRQNKDKTLIRVLDCLKEKQSPPLEQFIGYAIVAFCLVAICYIKEKTKNVKEDYCQQTKQG